MDDLGKELILDPKCVMPFQGQPRKRFRGIKQLAESILTIKQTTPIIVTRLATPIDGYLYELTDGERRLRACLEYSIPIKAVLSQADVKDKYAQSVAANFCRQSHDSMEIAHAVKTLYDQGRTMADIAAIFGKSASWCSSHAGLLSLCPECQSLLTPDDDGKTKINYSTAISLVNLNENLQRQAAQWILQTKPNIIALQNYVRHLKEKHPDQIKGGGASGRKHARSTQPSEHYEALLNAVMNLQVRFNRWELMTNDALLKVLASQRDEQLLLLIDGLQDAAATLTALAATAKSVVDKKQTPANSST